jgi:hypothetical protein
MSLTSLHSVSWSFTLCAFVVGFRFTNDTILSSLGDMGV